MQTGEGEGEPHVAEVYDQTETQTMDVELIRTLIGPGGPLRILEPFCGNGRILIPLALAGHELVGLDQAHGMLVHARAKIARLPQDVQNRITLLEGDAVAGGWPQAFDLVVLGGNCFYELATLEEQARCVRSAAAALVAGGHVYIDNDHMEGGLDPAWQEPGEKPSFPTGDCADGTRLESTLEPVWFDAPRRLIRFRRRTRITWPDGSATEKEYIMQKHPVSTAEVQASLEANGFAVERLFGDRGGTPYTELAGRAIFWARRT